MMNRQRKLVIGLIAVVLAATGGYGWWSYLERHPSTSDAYTDANVVRVAAQVSGKILKINVSDHEHVTDGQLMLEIDPQPYQIRVERAQANLELSKQQMAETSAAVETAQARVAETEAKLADARRQHMRMQALLKKQSVSRAQADAARYKLREFEAGLKGANSELQQSRQKQLEAAAAAKLAQAELAQAELDLSHTRIVAPAPGYLGALSVRPGDVIAKGQALFPLVEDQHYWVNANFKETDLQRIKVNQPATVQVDMYPGKTFHGVVESISPASGVSFSLLPPENATGNWVKVTQRFPVRVRIVDAGSDKVLRIGASSVVTIDTTTSS